MTAGLLLAGVGLLMLTQVGTTNGLLVLVGASVVISLGLAPVFGLTTDLIVSSAPPERAGSASGMSETFFELGGALGISILGSVGVAIYRGGIADRLPSSVPADAVAAARDTLGAAVEVAGGLPAPAREALLTVARESFVDGIQIVAAVGVVMAIAVAAFTFRALGHIPPTDESATDEAAATSRTPGQVPQTTFYCG
jgi:DHA2 family multidrug resistance protein-like MFS transporter